MTWQLGSTLIVCVAVAVGLAWYELRRPPAKLVALVAALAALAVAGRVLFAAIPNVQATTDVALLSGYALGPAPGFVVGAIAALASNVFLGQGPWTPWEMLGWGAAGLLGAWLAVVSRRRLGRLPLAVACAIAGFLFGAWMDLFTLVAFTDSSTQGYLAISVVSLPFNIAHAVGNFLICLAFGPAFVRMLVRFRLRLTVRWRLAAPTATLIALVLLLAVAPAATASTGDAVRYLERAQHRDGGFGPTRDAPSSQLITGWTALGLEAAGRNPLDRRGGRRTAIDYLRSGAGSLRDIGEIERTILALRGAGVSARRFAGRDLVGELVKKRRSDGSWNEQANWTAFGILALRASGTSRDSRAIRRSADWLARQQNDDGGYSFGTKGGGSFVDETGAALQALAAAGRRGRTAKQAIAYLHRAQNADGGFGQSQGQRSNAQSTAWAIQGLAAGGSNPRDGRGGKPSPVRFLTSLQQADGSFRYSRSSTQTPVWVTAQAVAAVRLVTLPYRPAPRRTARRALTPSPATAAAHPRAARSSASRTRHARRHADLSARPRVTVRPAAQVEAPVAAKRGGRKARDIVVLAVAIAVILLAALIYWLLRE
jgi:energy-coupling factor transport system substrate-specific component